MNRDERKNQLESKIDNATNAIKNQLGEYKGKGQNALIIGGIIVAGYALSRIFINDDDDDVVVKATNISVAPKKPSMITNALSGIASTVLLTVLKSKLEEYLEKSAQNNEK